MWILAVVILSICIGFDMGDLAAFKQTGEHFLDMDAWYNSTPVSVLNVVLLVLLIMVNWKEI